MASATDSPNPRGNGIPKPFVIGVAGGTASGKSTVCAKIMEQLGQTEVDRRQRQVAIVSQDSFYRILNDNEKDLAAKGQFDFDHPDAYDSDFMMDLMGKIVSGKTVNIPTYDYQSNSRRNSVNQAVYPADVVLLEGILVFYFPELRNMFHMKLFVDTDPDTRLSRRVLRDIKERGRDLDTILTQYTTLVKPAFEEFCLPGKCGRVPSMVEQYCNDENWVKNKTTQVTKKYADVIIPRGADNTVAIDLIVQHIQELLRPTKEQVPKRFRHNSDSFVGRPH